MGIETQVNIPISIADLSKLPENRGPLVLSNEVHRQFGNVPLIRMNWGTYIDKDAYIRIELPIVIKAKLLNEGKYSDKDYDTQLRYTQDFIEKCGFDGAWHNPDHLNITSDEVQNFHVSALVNGFKTAARKRGWKGYDKIAIASTSTRYEVIEEVKKGLEKENIGCDQAVLIGEACAGGADAMCDLAADPYLYGKQVGDGGIESLSGRQMNRLDPSTYFTFGNAVVIAAFKPGIEIEHLYGKTKVVKDNNIINIQRIYERKDLAASLGEIEPPSYFEFQDEESRKIFSAFADGSRGLDMPTKTDEFGRGLPGVVCDMNGRQAIYFFGKNSPSHTFDVMQEILAKFPDSSLAFDLLVSNLNIPIAHQPTAKVNEGVNNQSMGEAKKRKYPVLPIMIPWLMRGTKTNNASAATTLVMMGEAFNNPYFMMDKTTPVISYGIGGIFICHFIKFHVV